MKLKPLKGFARLEEAANQATRIREKVESGGFMNKLFRKDVLFLREVEEILHKLLEIITNKREEILKTLRKQPILEKCSDAFLIDMLVYQLTYLFKEREISKDIGMKELARIIVGRVEENVYSIVNSPFNS